MATLKRINVSRRTRIVERSKLAFYSPRTTSRRGAGGGMCKSTLEKCVNNCYPYNIEQGAVTDSINVNGTKSALPFFIYCSIGKLTKKTSKTLFAFPFTKESFATVSAATTTTKIKCPSNPPYVSIIISTETN